MYQGAWKGFVRISCKWRKGRGLGIRYQEGKEGGKAVDFMPRVGLWMGRHNVKAIVGRSGVDVCGANTGGVVVPRVPWELLHAPATNDHAFGVKV
jgi:hypothetical protein